jgi:HK97 family phage prohead protease
MNRIDIDSRDQQVLERSEKAVERLRRGGTMNYLSNEDDLSELCLEGFSMIYNRAFVINGKAVYFEPRSFTASLNGSSPIALQIDHIANNVIGTTRDGLSFVDSEEGLAFRFPLKNVPRGAMVAHMCKTGQRAAISVGCDIIKDRVETISGVEVQIVERATLKEISLCKEGAVGNAFAALVNIKTSPPLTKDKSAAFNINYAFHRINNGLRKSKRLLDDTYGQKSEIDFSGLIAAAEALKAVALPVSQLPTTHSRPSNSFAMDARVRASQEREREANAAASRRAHSF